MFQCTLALVHMAKRMCIIVFSSSQPFKPHSTTLHIAGTQINGLPVMLRHMVSGLGELQPKHNSYTIYNINLKWYTRRLGRFSLLCKTIL